MTKLMFACIAALALTACPHKSSNDSGAAIARMGEFKDKMCACKTPACASDVTTEMTKWSQEMTKAQGDKPPAMSGEDTKKLTAISEELAKCTSDASKVAVPTPEAPPTPVAPEATGSGSAGSAGSATK